MRMSLIEGMESKKEKKNEEKSKMKRQEGNIRRKKMGRIWRKGEEEAADCGIWLEALGGNSYLQGKSWYIKNKLEITSVKVGAII